MYAAPTGLASSSITNPRRSSRLSMRSSQPACSSSVIVWSVYMYDAMAGSLRQARICGPSSFVSGRIVVLMSTPRYARRRIRARCTYRFAREARSFPELLPRDVLVHARFGGQSEHALGHDVAQDLRRPALDGVALGAQVAVAGVTAGEIDRVRPHRGPVGVAQALLTEQLQLQAGQLLVQPGEGELHRRPLRPGLAERQLLPQPRAGEPGDLRLDPQPQQPVVQLGSTPLRLLAPGPRHHPDHAAFTWHGMPTDGHPLVVEGGRGHRPALPLGPEPLAVRDPHVGEEDLVELRLAGDLPQRPYVDAGDGHVAQEVGEAAVLGHVGVGAGDQDPEPGVVSARGPHLLAVDHPVLTVA